MNAYKPGRRNGWPLTWFLIGMTLAAVALSMWLLYMTGARFR